MSNERLPCVRCTSRRCAFQHIKKCLRRKKRALVLDKNIACIDLLSPAKNITLYLDAASVSEWHLSGAAVVHHSSEPLMHGTSQSARVKQFQ